MRDQAVLILLGSIGLGYAGAIALSAAGESAWSVLPVLTLATGLAVGLGYWCAARWLERR